MILIELSPGENRKIKADDIANKWRTLIGDIPGIKDLTISTDLDHFLVNFGPKMVEIRGSK